MAEYIDKQAFLDHMKGTSRYFDVKFDIENFPNADVVSVVRCNDCKYADGKKESVAEKQYAADILFCRNSEFCGDEPLAMWPDDFCSYGKRKGGNNDA